MIELLECSSSELYRVGKELAEAGIGIRVAVRGQSMWPFLRTGDVVEVTPLPLEQAAVGDVVFFWSGSQLLAHRVVDLFPGDAGICLVTRGDGLSREDRPIRKQADLIGRIEVVYRGDRTIRLDRGPYRFFGRLWARHRSVRRAGRLALRTLGALRSLFAGFSGESTPVESTGDLYKAQRENHFED